MNRAHMPTSTTDLQRRYTRIDGFRIRSLHAGISGSPLVLLHGLAGSHRWWRYVVPGLACHYRVIVPELVGFGGSRPAPRQPDMPEMADLMERWLEAQGLERTDLVGHSMGGEVAIHLATRAPERIRRLVLVSAAGVPREVSASAAAKLATDLAALRVWGRTSFVATIAGDSLRAGPFTLYRTLRHLLADDVRPLLPRIPHRTLLIWGEHDPITPVRDGVVMRDALRNARLVVVPAAAHNVMADRPEEFVRLVVDFLGEEEAPEPAGESGRADEAARITAGGHAVRLLRAGSGPAVVLVHGLGLGADVWEYHVARLAREGYDVLAPDLPGFGPTTGPSLGWSVDKAARWLADFADEAGVRRAVWVGHSVSAQYVLRLCALRPYLVGGMVLAAPTGEPGTLRWLSQLLGLARTSVREPLPLVGRVLRHYLTTPPLRTIGTWLGGRRHDSLADARRVDCRLRVVLGGRDPVVPVAFAARLAESAPAGDLVVIPDSAHGVALAPPEPFCRVLLSFLEKTTAGGSRGRAVDRNSDVGSAHE